MHKSYIVLTSAAVAALALTFSGCGGSKPKSELEKMVDDMVDPETAVTKYELAAKIKRDFGGEAIPVILEATYNAKMKEKGYSPDHAYSLVLIQIEAEPERLNACKAILFGDEKHKPHANKNVRMAAVEGLTFAKSTEEGLKIAVDLAKNSPDRWVKATALRAISYAWNPKYDAEICTILRRATSDPDQNVREHAQRGLDRRREKNGCR